MIKKDKLLRQLDTAIKSEERLIPLLNKHVSSSLFFSGLKENERKAIVERLQKIVLTETKHIELLNGIKDEITKGKNNVY